MYVEQTSHRLALWLGEVAVIDAFHWKMTLVTAADGPIPPERNFKKIRNFRRENS